MKRWAEWLYDYRAAATIVVVLLTLFFAWEVKHLDISTRFSDLYPRNHPYIKIFEKYPAFGDRKSTRLNSSHIQKSRMPSSA